MSKKSITIASVIAIVIIIAIAISIAISKINIKPAISTVTSKPVVGTLVSKVEGKDVKTVTHVLVAGLNVKAGKTEKLLPEPTLTRDKALKGLSVLGDSLVANLKVKTNDKKDLKDVLRLTNKQFSNLVVAGQKLDDLGLDNLLVVDLNKLDTLGLGVQLDAGVKLDKPLLSELKLNDRLSDLMGTELHKQLSNVAL